MNVMHFLSFYYRRLPEFINDTSV